VPKTKTIAANAHAPSNPKTTAPNPIWPSCGYSFASRGKYHWLNTSTPPRNPAQNAIAVATKVAITLRKILTRMFMFTPPKPRMIANSQGLLFFLSPPLLMPYLNRSSATKMTRAAKIQARTIALCGSHIPKPTPIASCELHDRVRIDRLPALINFSWVPTMAGRGLYAHSIFVPE